jgi:HAE1 family hydrophobic/amphiphilic exporter-1
MDGKMTLVYTAEAETRDFFALKARVRERLAKLPVPEGFEITTDPRDRGFEHDVKSTVFAMALALFLVFFVMGLLFESILLPFSVLLSVPFAFFGALWALLISGVTLDAGGMVGMIMLVGIVVNNAIVLVDAINRCRREGTERRAAVLEAAQVRFRPIWMTALTTIFGLVPLVLFPQTGEGMDYKSMAVILIGGLATSTFFTLFVVPLFYTFLDDLGILARDLLRGPASARIRASSGGASR